MTTEVTELSVVRGYRFMSSTSSTHQQNCVPNEVRTPAGDRDTEGVGVKVTLGVTLGVTLNDGVILGVLLIVRDIDAVAVWVASQNCVTVTYKDTPAHSDKGTLTKMHTPQPTHQKRLCCLVNHGPCKRRTCQPVPTT
jgi:hypothetical protein